ncbi:MAG: dehydrogenase [Segetibacter sp.]|nr:dehydrogenase [Segetibacter sp.]
MTFRYIFSCKSRLLCYLAAIITLVAACSHKRYTNPLSPEEALKSFRLSEDFNIEIFAAEPFILDPVDLVFDEEGKAYVVEMFDYPYPPKEGKAAGRIRLLIDTNGDGRIDKSTVFADSLSEATSIFPWKGGLIVTAAPYIMYLKDTNGDFRADTREVLFSGFFNKNSEAQITSLRFGIDNWIYANNRGQDGLIDFSRKADTSHVSVRGADFRFRLDKDQFEPETGPGQFGQMLDRWGHRFFTENSIHIEQPVIPWRYLHRHPYLPSTTAVVNISDHDPIMFQETPPPYWRAERTNRRNKQYQEQKLSRVEYADDHFTGISGAVIYLADAFPQEYYGNIFSGDVAGNLVHRDIITLSPDSARFTAKRANADKSREFLSSKDPWFRPANVTVGPDGNLYVIDMYRQHIETPVSIPEDLQTDMDFLRGSDKGRIYRIVPKKGKAAKPAASNVKNLQSAQLVDLLPSSDQWFAIQAQRLLLERQDASVTPLVKAMFTTHNNPAARLHALFVLEGLNALDASLIKQAVKDRDPNVRENGLILAERYQQMLPLTIIATKDSIARVAMQATLSLGEFKGQEVIPTMAAVLQKHMNDRWFRMAVLSADAGSSIQFLHHLVNKTTFLSQYDSARVAYLEDISFVIGFRNQTGEITQVLKLISATKVNDKSRWQLAALKGLSKGLKKLKTKPIADAELKQALQNIESGNGKETGDMVTEIRKLLQ